MSDSSNSNTPEYVAFLLTQEIASTEDLRDHSENFRKEYLDLYAECLKATTGARPI